MHFRRQYLNCGGQYVCNEWVVKNVKHNHPCKLTKTRVKVTVMPGMENRVLNSFLESKKSNLIKVMRCEGQCRNNNGMNPVDCIPTKLHFKKVKIDIKTRYQRDVQNVSR